MATLPLIRYELDPSGTSPNNSVVGEVHQLVPRTVRVVAPSYGAFFTESVKVKDLATNQYLARGTQFYGAELYEIPTAKFGKEICAILVITDPSVSDNISLEYQALGGEFSVAADAVIAQILALQNDNRPVQWGSVIAKPSEYPPSHHLHDIGDVYGFEYIVHALDRVRAAIEMGDSYSHDQIYQYIDSLRAGYQSAIDAANQQLADHIGNQSNPHHTTAAQVGAYTTAQTDAIGAAIQLLITNHAARADNPHSVTAAQVGAYTRAQVDTAIGVVQTALTAHINAANPHPQYVRNDVGQGLDAGHQATARNNIGAEVVGTAGSTMAAHLGNGNPHPQYLAGMGTVGTRYVDSGDPSYMTGVAFVYDVGVEMVSGNQFRIVAYRRVGTATYGGGGCGGIGGSSL